jgi:putative PEP-CTERM system histidine kinase
MALPLSFPSLSFAVAALAFLASALWAFQRREEPLRSRRFRWALLVNALWASLLTPGGLGLSWPLLTALEVFRYGAWFLAMPALLSIGRGAAFWPWRLNLVIWIAGLVIAVWSPGLCFLLLAFTGLLNIEQLLRNAQLEQRRGAKLCAVGLGGMFAYDLYLYSHLAFLNSPNEYVWAFRGLINAVFLLFLLVGAQRLTKVPGNLFVSRQVVFYSTAFLAVGIYLVIVAVAAYYLRGVTGFSRQWLQPLLLMGTGIVLAVLLTTESPWRRWRVFLAKHFYSNKYDYRVEWLRFVDMVAGHQQGDARITSIRAIAQIFESPGGLLFLRDTGSGAYEAAARWSEEDQAPEKFESLSSSHDMVRFMNDKEWVIDLDEYRKDPGIYQSIGLPQFLLRRGATWRIVSPLFERNQLQGFMVLSRPPDPFTMTFEDRDLLRMMGRHVAILLAQQMADRRLAESRQFDAFNRFVAFVMHDLKNSVAQLQLLASNATRHRHNPQFIDDAFVTIENTAGRIARLIGQLQSRDARAGDRALKVEEILRQAIARCAAQEPRPECQGPGEAILTRADPERLVAVFEHILRNAQDATGATGRVWVRIAQASGMAEVTIGDTGSGMDPEFVRERLFRPFDSTKGSRGMGIGAYQAREYVREIGGTVEVQSTPGSGTQFIVRLPQCQNDNSEY